jgi:hypothetical protein
MDIVLTVITPLIVGFGAFVAFALSRRENRRKNEKLNRRNFVIRSTYTWGVVMITLDTLLVMLLILGNVGEPLPIGLDIVLALLIIAFSFGSVQIFRERVTVKENTIIYTPVIGRKREYSFGCVDRVENRKTGVHVFVNGKKAFTLDPSGIGTQLFIDIYKTREF